MPVVYSVAVVDNMLCVLPHVDQEANYEEDALLVGHLFQHYDTEMWVKGHRQWYQWYLDFPIRLRIMLYSRYLMSKSS